MRPKYLTDGYIQEMESYIYNDRSPLDHPDYLSAVSGNDSRKAKELTQADEKFVFLDGNLDDVIVTNKCRAISVERIKQYSVKFTPNKIVIYIRNIKIDTDKIFEDNGWEYDIQKLKDSYIKNNWHYVDWHGN